MKNNALAFDKLPADIRERLVELQTPAADRFVFIPKLSKLHYAAIVAGLAWSAYLFASTQGYLWEPWMFGLLAAGSVVFVTLALGALYRLAAARLAKLKDGWVVTADEAIKTRGGTVEFWSLKEFEGFQFREDINTIELWIGERLEKIPLDDPDEARRLEERFVELRNAAGDSFLRPFATPANAPAASAGLALKLGGLAALAVVALGLAFAAQVLNRRHDDEKMWRGVEQATTVGELEQYTVRHPNGLFKAEADRRIAEILGRVREDYAKKVRPGADPNAVKGLTEFIEMLGRLPDRTVHVRITETRELDDAVVKKMRQATGYQIATYDYSMPPAEENFRREHLAKQLGLAFQPALRPASVEFRRADEPPPNATVLDVRYLARSAEVFYYFNWYSNGSLTTFYNPGATFDFDLTMRAPDGRELYRTNYSSLIRQLMPGGFFDQRDASNYSFDKVYFASVADDFTKHLGRQFGLAE